MPPFLQHPGNRSRGFTILEILVAVAVLALLTVLVAQMVGSGSAVIAGSRKHLSADAQAREVFSRFALDLAQMPKRADLDAIFSDQTGNKKIFFYSEVPGFAATTNALSSLALVGYRIGAEAGLERLGKALPWSGQPAFLTFSDTNSSNALAASTLAGAWGASVGTAPTYDGTDPDFHPLAPGVFRFEYCFLKKDGSLTLTRDPEQSFRDVAAIVLSLAVLDGDSRRIAPDLSRLADALPSPTSADLAANKLPAEIWRDLVNNNATFAASAGIPAPAASSVRIYQRAFPLRTP
jgi:prepilin-type N-terminal cleavage/methylation domain-containing protein